MMGAVAVVYQTGPLPVVPASNTRVPVLAAPFCCLPWPQKTTDGPCTHMGDPKETADFQFHTGPAPAGVAMWGVTQRMEDVSVFPSVSVILTFKLHKQIFF